MRYVLFFGGVIMFGLGLRALRRLQTLEVKYYALALISGGVCIMVWSPENALYLDQLTRVTGIGRLLTYACGATSMLAQYAMITELGDQWSSWRRIASVMGVMVIASLFPLWNVARDAVGRGSEHRLYEGYFSRPPALLTWNVAAGGAILFVSALALYSMWAVPLECPGRRVRRLLHGDRYVQPRSFLPYVVGVLYGLLQMGQVVASKTGVDESRLFLASNWLFGGGAIIAVAFAATLVTTVVGRRVRRLGSRTMERDILEGQADIALLCVVVFDLIVHLRYSVDPSIIHALKTRCQTYATMGSITAGNETERRNVQRWWKLRGRKREIWHGRAALIEMSVGLYKQVVPLLDDANSTFAQAVRQRCQRLKFSTDHLRIAEHAAWLIAYGRAVRIEQPWRDTDLAAAQLVDRAIARDALRKVKQSVYFYADAYLVVALALNFELVSTTPSRGHEPQRWHYMLATQVAQALMMHDQSFRQPNERSREARMIGRA